MASEQKRPDVLQRRSVWMGSQFQIDPPRLVFIDETWVKTYMTRPRGRSFRGTRLIDRMPHGHWKTTNFLAALRCTDLTAPPVIDGPVNVQVFLNSVHQELSPILQPSDIVSLRVGPDVNRTFQYALTDGLDLVASLRVQGQMPGG